MSSVATNAVSNALPIVLDDAEEWGAFSHPVKGKPGFWSSSVVIEGMHCAACSFSIEDALQKVPGVVSAQVSAASRRAKVVWSEQRVQPSTWFDAVRQAGYLAHPANDMLRSESRQSETRMALWRLLVAGLCMMQVMMYAYPAYIAQPGDLSFEMEQLLRWASWVLTLPMMLFSSGPFFTVALRDLSKGRIGMDLPVSLGIGITFLVSTVGTFEPHGIFGKEVYFDSLTMFVFFLLTGRWLELRLRDRTAGALDALMNRLPDTVERELPDGSFERVAARRLSLQDLIRVQPGQSFPADGVIESGHTEVNEALMTGESRPISKQVNDLVLCGSHNLAGTVLVRVNCIGASTRFAQVVALMESAASSKPQIAQLVDRLARPFLAFVLIAAGLACSFWWSTDPGHALMVAVAVLVVTCPCALSLATPASMLASAGALAKAGVLVRRLHGFEILARVTTLVFDKTGTLTDQKLVLKTPRTRPGLAPEDALQIAAALAQHSGHPVARSVMEAALRQLPKFGPAWTCDLAQERVGEGLTGIVKSRAMPDLGRQVRLGRPEFCGEVASHHATTAVCLADSSGWLATFEMEEALRPGAVKAVAALTDLGVSVHMLSGDRASTAIEIAKLAGITQVQGDCTPSSKLERLRSMQASGDVVAMVGDGLNDGPVLAGADVSIAFGKAVPLAQAKSDFVILGDDIQLVVSVLRRAKKTMRVVRQNLFWAIGYNAACVPLAIAGLLPAWLAGLGMAASSLAVVMNAMRLTRADLMEAAS